MMKSTPEYLIMVGLDGKTRGLLSFEWSTRATKTSLAAPCPAYVSARQAGIGSAAHREPLPSLGSLLRLNSSIRRLPAKQQLHQSFVVELMECSLDICSHYSYLHQWSDVYLKFVHLRNFQSIFHNRPLRCAEIL